MKGIARLRGTTHHRKIVLGKQIVTGITHNRRIHSHRIVQQQSLASENNTVKSRYAQSTSRTIHQNQWIQQALCKTNIIYPNFHSIIGIKHMHSSKTPLSQNFSAQKHSTHKDLEVLKLDELPEPIQINLTPEEFSRQGLLRQKIKQDARRARWAKLTWKELSSEAFREAKHIAVNFWEGIKKLWKNSRIGYAIYRKKMSGVVLSRAEDRFFRQAKRDLVRSIPFILVWRIPLIGDFLLPWFVARYPELLPSTFTFGKEKPQLQEILYSRRIKQINALLKIKQDKTDTQTALSAQMSNIETLLENGRTTLSAKRITEFKDLLETFVQENEIHVARIEAVCDVLGLNNLFKPDWMIEKAFHKHIEYVKHDDLLINKEGIDSLSSEDLVDACMERGLQVLKLPAATLQVQLREWLQFSMTNPNTITPLLIYAHGFKRKELNLKPDDQNTE